MNIPKQDYIMTVFDNRLKKIICSGVVKQWKTVGEEYVFSSIDGIYFFKETPSKNSKFKILKNFIDEEIKLESIPDDYNIVLWNHRWIINREYNKKLNLKNEDKYLIDPEYIDVYEEIPYDIECIPLINTLNKIPGITTVTSCCGHGRIHFQICCYCQNFDSLIKMSNLLPDDVHICISNKYHIQQRTDAISFCVEIMKIGQEAYDLSKEFSNILINGMDLK